VLLTNPHHKYDFAAFTESDSLGCSTGLGVESLMSVIALRWKCIVLEICCVWLQNQQLVVSVNQVKSTAVVKYANIETPAWFQELQRNTNLNNPPSSWSHGSRNWEKYIHNMSGQEHLPFSRWLINECNCGSREKFKVRITLDN